jgi:archaellum component FlaG (FlaF/FlaG flagellin family)
VAGAILTTVPHDLDDATFVVWLARSVLTLFTVRIIEVSVVGDVGAALHIISASMDYATVVVADGHQVTLSIVNCPGITNSDVALHNVALGQSPVAVSQQHLSLILIASSLTVENVTIRVTQVTGGGRYSWALTFSGHFKARFHHL